MKTPWRKRRELRDAEWERMELEAAEMACRVIHSRIVQFRSENPRLTPHFLSKVAVNFTVDGESRPRLTPHFLSKTAVTVDGEDR